MKKKVIVGYIIFVLIAMSAIQNNDMQTPTHTESNMSSDILTVSEDTTFSSSSVNIERVFKNKKQAELCNKCSIPDKSCSQQSRKVLFTICKGKSYLHTPSGKTVCLKNSCEEYTHFHPTDVFIPKKLRKVLTETVTHAVPDYESTTQTISMPMTFKASNLILPLDLPEMFPSLNTESSETTETITNVTNEQSDNCSYAEAVSVKEQKVTEACVFCFNKCFDPEAIECRDATKGKPCTKKGNYHFRKEGQDIMRLCRTRGCTDCNLFHIPSYVTLNSRQDKMLYSVTGCKFCYGTILGKTACNKAHDEIYVENAGKRLIGHAPTGAIICGHSFTGEVCKASDCERIHLPTGWYWNSKNVKYWESRLN